MSRTLPFVLASLLVACGAPLEAAPCPGGRTTRDGACASEGGAIDVPPDVAPQRKSELRVAGDPGADEAALAGAWVDADGGWGDVEIQRNAGSYTATYGKTPGRFELVSKGGRSYSGVWGESKARHGTMTLELSPDGTKLVGKWAADPDCTIGDPSASGSITWIKKR